MKFEIINKLKKEKGLTNAQIANQAGVTLSTLDKITAGINTNPKLDTLQAICKVLGCRLDDFDDNNPKIETDILKEKLLRNYDSMNKEGRDRLVTYSDDLIASGNYDAKTVRIKVQKSVARMKPGESYEDIPAVDEIKGTIVTSEEDL